MAARIRRSVYSLPTNSSTLSWYRRAVGALKLLPRNQPGSWEFMAACHGIPSNVPVPATANGFWNQCQHQTWFFLSWHRGYLAAFEALIAAQVAKLGGPATWALPYWNYSEAANPNARRLPPAFRGQFLADGSVNHLWAPRNQPVAPATVLTLSAGNVSLSALQNPIFSPAPGSFASSFGGPRTGFTHFGGTNGAVESLPHNVIHTNIGGLMSNPNTAAFDPIFWLHHCNIDRLWEVWRRQTNPPRDPSQAQWLTGVPFKLVRDNGVKFNFTSNQALNTQTLLHGYRYDSVTPVVPAAAPAAIASAKGAKKSAAAKEGSVMAELTAASEKPMALAGKRAEVLLKSGAKTKALAGQESVDTTRQYYLVLENVTASGPARDYKVFVDLPSDDRVPIQLGVLATFGVETSSDPKGAHGGSGLSQVFDATAAVEELGPGATDVDNLRVTFDPVNYGEVETSAGDYPFADTLKLGPAGLTVGRISLYAE
jgi:tyrosinase